MKENIFCLIIDALSFPYMNDKYNAMPFLKSLQNSGHNCLNMYSQGPYTEAALTPFYTGRDNMDFGGNFFRGQQTPLTTFEAFRNDGFNVINYTQPLIYPKPMSRGINQERYGVCYFFAAVWDYRLSYFAELNKSGKLTEKDYDEIYELVETNFEFWLIYFNKCKNSADEADFINLYSDRNFDFDKCIKEVSYQFSKYSENKQKYIDNIFKLGKKHEIFSIENYFMNSKAENPGLYKEIADKYSALFKKISNFNRKHNKSKDYSVLSLLKICSKLIAGKKSDALNCAKKYHYYKKIYSTKSELKKLFELKSNYKPEPSILNYFGHFCTWYNKRKGKAKSFYCTMHVSDLHTPEIFFSIDAENISQVKNELDIAESFLDSLPSDFSGNVIYYLSMRYVDYCIEKMFCTLKNMGLTDNTLFVITADHGSSFGFRPVRTSLVNNEHDENYHIPCVIYGKNVLHNDDERFYTTKDIVKTILEYSNINNPVFTGKNILDLSHKNEYAITEYLGAGCPDISRRPLFFVIRDVNYCIGMKQYVTEEFSVDNIFCVYDRKNDVSENVNIKNSVDIIQLDFLINKLQLRFNEIQGDYYANKT